MCGICGIFRLDAAAPPPDRELLERMVAALRHRGPDGTGGYQDAQIALGHARLAIVDRAGGAQPMTNETGELWLVGNGEIFDHAQLRRELEAAGHRFASHCDVETALHAYEQWGDECFAHLEGQFALAVWDRPRRRLLLARDRLGILPLHVAHAGGWLLFASEIKALFQEPRLGRLLDPHGLDQTFTFWSPQAPRTAFAGVEQLPPGTWRCYEQERATLERRYWRLSFPPDPGPCPPCSPAAEARLAGELAARLAEATRRRLQQAEVPVGVYLSGGLDSSLLVALAARTHTRPLPTFSLRFADPDYDEGPYQRAIVEAFGTDHTELRLTAEDIAEALPATVAHAETPLLRSAAAPLGLLAGAVRQQGLSVVLSGEGADELFLGYDLFREAKVRRFWARNPASTLRPRLLDRLYPWLARAPRRAGELQAVFFGRGLARAAEPIFGHLPRWETTRALQRLFSPELRHALAAADPIAELVAGLPPAIASWAPLDQSRLLEVETLLTSHLLCAQGDRQLQSQGVEGRFPYLDEQVIRGATGLSPGVLLPRLVEKRLLKVVAADRLPAKLVRRPKQPYRAPGAGCFVHGRGRELLAALTTPAALHAAGLFDPVAVARLVAKLTRPTPLPPSNSDEMALLGILTCQLLHQHFVVGEGLAATGQPLEVWHGRQP